MCFAFPVKVLKVDGNKATVEASGEKKKVDASLLDGLKAGDYVLAHGDLAIQKLGKKEAEETLAILNELCEC